LFDIQLVLKPKGERLYIGLVGGEDLHALVHLLMQAVQFMDSERSTAVEPTVAGD
jgi:hypothetical protein